MADLIDREELKPCPFCGNEDTLLESYPVRKGYEATIQCNGCISYVTTITYDTEQKARTKAIEAWNKRTPADTERHAHWVKSNTESGLYNCSSCGRPIRTTGAKLICYPYCYCGCKMDENIL